MTDVNINVVAHELDPSKKYVLEVRRGELGLDATSQLVRTLKANGINGFVVVSETGEAIKVNEIPEEV